MNTQMHRHECNTHITIYLIQKIKQRLYPILHFSPVLLYIQVYQGVGADMAGGMDEEVD
jgi:hypothetical protein